MAHIVKVPARIEWVGLDYVKVFVDAWDYAVPAITVLTSDLPEHIAEAIVENKSTVIVETLVDLEADSADKVIIRFEDILPVPEDSELFG